MDHALEKLSAMGYRLPFPHQSAVKGAPFLRELRPRSGSSPWRGLYAQVGGEFVLLAIAPEAEVDARGFRRAVDAAQQRLQELTE